MFIDYTHIFKFLLNRAEFFLFLFSFDEGVSGTNLGNLHMAVWVLLPQILKLYRPKRLGGGGECCSFSKLLFCKEEHQTQPIELKCLAHEICDFVGEGCFGSLLSEMYIKLYG